MIINQHYTRSLKRRPQLGSAFLIFTVFLFGTACSSTINLKSNDNREVSYSIVSVVHADADYLYHENGKAKYADVKAVNQSIEIAKKAKQGEVFIFHQRPERKAFLFFPKKDRIYYHYKYGSLISKGKYSPEDGGFTKESEIYSALTQNQNKQQTYFAYFGHEIPTFSERSYHRSSARMEFNTKVFANHLTGFSSHIALTILSTCNNGNPLMMDHLKNVTDLVIASPQNLHLSYLKTDKFELLESDPQIKTKALADSIAQDSFSDLSSFLQTAVTVAVYSLDEISNYISSLNRNYEVHLESVEAKPLFTNNADCKNIDSLESSFSTKGVEVFYKPASFGRRAANTSHSGWGCKN